jgi:transcriptional regulator with XRE-family HTH domain
MQLKGHTVESAALASSIPAQIIQAAMDHPTPARLVRLIESMIPDPVPPAPPTRQDIIRKARGERTIEQQAALCDSTVKRYVAVEDGLCQPLSPRIFSRGLGLTPEAVCAPMRNALYHARVARGVSQQSMANAMGISQSQLSKIETGMCKFGDVEAVQAYLDGKEMPEKEVDKYAYLRHKHNLTVADIMSLTGLSKDQVTYGCPELDSFFERISQ